MTKKINYWQLVILSFLCMFIFGFVENLRGVTVPEIRDYFEVNYISMGVLLFISGFGYMSATFGSGLLADRIGAKKVMILGFLLLIIGCGLFLTLDTFIMTLLAIFIINLGFGSFEIATNSLAAQIFVRNTALMMNFMHLFYGLASTLSPQYGKVLLLNDYSWKLIFVFAMVPVVIVLIYVFFSRFPEESKEEEHNQPIPMKTISKDKKVWLFIAICGLGQVAELGTGTWIANFLQEARNMSAEKSLDYMFWFFVFFTLGRLVGGYISERFGYGRSIAWFSASYIVFMLGGLLLDNHFAILFALTGFSVSILFPTVMSMVMREFKAGRSSIMGFIITASGIVNLVISFWLIGVLNDLIGVTLGFASIGIFTGLAILFVVWLGPLLTYDKTETAASKE